MSISMVKKFYEMYENDAKVTAAAESKKRKRKNKNEKFNFKKAALIHDEAPELKEVDFTEENLKVIKKLSVINSVKSRAVDKIMEHEDRLSKKAKKEESDLGKDREPVFTDRDFDVFEKEYLDG